MEDVLDVYHRPFDPGRPVICIDEQPRQLVSETRVPLPPRPGNAARFDYEYKREGVANLFMIFQPLLGWRHVMPTERRTAVDFAEVLRWLAEDLCPDAKKLVHVVDNLNTHTPACLYEAFDPVRARRIAERLEWHYTPKHGSWLNMAEIELSVLARQCLDRRIPDRATLAGEVAAWAADRNAAMAGAAWRFTTDDARIRLKKLYPTIELQ